jgi:3-oxoacyl-[acyl-carrier-protein] synthase I
MGGIMITKIADNIISPLGLTSEDNLRSIINGESRICSHEGAFGLPEAFCGSLIDRKMISEMFASHSIGGEDLTLFEKLCILSATEAISECSLQAENDDVIFVLSTTKGNVDMLEGDIDDPRCYLAESAKKIAEYFGNHNTPIVASNACISGVCAQIAAVRALSSGKYRYAVVIGCDLLSRFIISGFQSFKALSPDPCKPFDKERIGLNLGEAAGTIILEREKVEGKRGKGDYWEFIGCSNHNDANHISGPSRTGEGSYRVLSDILEVVDKDDLAFVNLHGTATAYNDEMESIALHRAGLSDTPANGLKGFYGHTLGAAGIIETILSMHALDNGIILPTRGFVEKGTTYDIAVKPEIRHTDKKTFIKILSGFGGSNAGIAYRKCTEEQPSAEEKAENVESRSRHKAFETVAEVRITPEVTSLNGEKISEESITGLYRRFAGDYPKFFKMDSLCKLGFMGAELLLKDIPAQERENIAVILFNRNGSLITDRNYQKTIADDNYFPSPALFVYTLANIVTGEIAIRNKTYGETSFYLLDEYDPKKIEDMVKCVAPASPLILTGWVDYNNDSDYLAELKLLKTKQVE